MALPGADDVPPAGKAVLLLLLLLVLLLPVPLLLLLPLLLQPARASAPATPTTAVRCQPRTGRLIDRSRTTCPPFR